METRYMIREYDENAIAISLDSFMRYEILVLESLALFD